MNEYQKQIDLISSKIATVSYANPPPYIHCSKINCFLRQIKELASKVLRSKVENYKKMTNTMRNNFSNLMNVLSQFQQLHSQCCGDICAQFTLTTSIRYVKTEIAFIRKDCIKYLENLGIKTASTYLHLDDAELDSQDRVDIKRIAVIINHLQMRPEIAKRDEVAPHLKNRLNSLDSLGIQLQSDEGRFETISFSELPSSLNYIVKYEDIEFGPLIGEGEAGKVYRGTMKTQNKNNVDCAIKILHCRSFSAYDYQMYRREICTMSFLRHPSLVRFYGYTTEPPYCVITEYMENGSLYDFLLQHPKEITPTDKTLIALDIARGLEFLHGRGIIHRDLKSLNILLDSRKRAKIADFGLTRMKSKDPMTGLVGTSHWMAPEVLMSSPYYDEKVDIYSFGILMWELLTSECPYQNESLDQATLTLQIMEQNKRPTIPPGTPPNLKALIESCWNKDPKNRPSCHEIISDLSNPSFQFPGSELVLMMQENHLFRFNKDQRSSLPIFRYINHNLVRNEGAFNTTFENGRREQIIMSLAQHIPIGLETNEVECVSKSLIKINDALKIGLIEHIENAISHFKAALKISKVDFHILINQYLQIILDNSNENTSKSSIIFITKLLNVFFELLNDKNCYCNNQACIETTMKECAISKIILSDKKELSNLAMSNMISNPMKIFFNDETLDALFEFKANSDKNVRMKALILLLYSIDFRFNDIVKNNIPSFIERMLNFTKRKIQNKILKLFLKKMLKIFKNSEEFEPSDVSRIPYIMLTTPKELRNDLSACIEALLIRFPTMRNSPIIFMNAIEDYESYGTLFQAVSIVDETQEPTFEMIKALAIAAEKNDEAFSNLIDFNSKFESSYDITTTNFLPIKNKNSKLLASFYALVIEKGNNKHKKKRNASFHKDGIEISDSLINFNQNMTYHRSFKNRSHSRTNSSIPIITSFEIEDNNYDDTGKNCDIYSYSSSPRFLSNINDNFTPGSQSRSPFNLESKISNSNFTKNQVSSISNINESLLKYEEFYKASALLLNSPLYTNIISTLLTSKAADPDKIQKSGICNIITHNVINETNEIDFLNLMFNLSCISFFKQFIIAIPKLFSNMRNSKDKEVVRLSFICLAVIAKSYTEEFDFYLLLRHAAKAVNTQTRFAQTASSFIFQKFISKTTNNFSFIKEITDIFIDSYKEPSRPASTVAKLLAEFATTNPNNVIGDELIQKLKEIADFNS